RSSLLLRPRPPTFPLFPYTTLFRSKFLLVPVLFFIVYGALGNAIAHSWWSIYWGKYFSGLYTAQAYWIFAPLLLAMFLEIEKTEDRKSTRLNSSHVKTSYAVFSLKK